MWVLPYPALTGAALGLLIALGQAPFGLWPVSLAALGGLIWLVSRISRPRAAARTAWAAGAGQFALALSWIVDPFFVDIARDGWMAPFAIAALAGGLALFWGASGALAVWLSRGARGRALAFALVLSAAELARGYVFTGFPWALPGHVWIGTPPAQLAAVFGQYGLTLMTLLAAALPVILPVGPGRAAGVGLAVLLLAAGWGWGAMRLATPLPAVADPVHIRVLQPNAAQHLKWRADMIPVFWRRQLSFTAAPSDPAPDLIVWPETAAPFLLDRAGDALATMSEAAGGVPVMFGVQRRAGPRSYNSLAVIGPSGKLTHIYDKHHLVPFGEYVPFASVLGRFGIKGLAADDVYGYAAGPGPRVLDLGAPLGHALPLICYEAVFPQDLRVATRPRWLVQITNDAWFGTWSGPYQHLALAQLRAVEQGLPMVRSANTGVSAIIDPYGRITESLPLNTAGEFTAPLPPALPETIYARTGDWPVALTLLAGLIALAAVRRADSR